MQTPKLPYKIFTFTLVPSKLAVISKFYRKVGHVIPKFTGLLYLFVI